jgi:hypothetical protein
MTNYACRIHLEQRLPRATAPCPRCTTERAEKRRHSPGRHRRRKWTDTESDWTDE